MLRMIPSEWWLGLFTAMAWLFSGCGGRTTENMDSADGGKPLPTCTQICNHAVGTCAPGANVDTCVADCEGARSTYASCPSKLDPYLRCMLTATVECRGGRVDIVSCDAERVAVQACARP